jgi:aminocarboxymuconate-semialdehyde decarboxylase
VTHAPASIDRYDHALRSLTHNGQALRFLIDRIGADHVVLGSDHPFDMGCDTPIDAVHELGLPPAQQNAVLGDTLAKLLKLY